MLIRASQGRVPGSPNFARKPPPPAPPIRGVTRKDVPATPPASPAGPEAKPATKRFSREGAPSGQKERTGLESKNNAHNKKTEAQDHEDPVDEQVRLRGGPTA